MAGLIQVGDMIKFSEVAWTVWNYGWASENNAGETYRAFGSEVRSLLGSLEKLEDAVEQTQLSLREYGARDGDFLGGDQNSLSEIIGDYDATLRECQQLLARNRRYDQTTGPARNIDWNINVMPQVEHLRSRIQMHNSRIQHVLKPFEIDLINKLHGDLVRRLTGLHRDVLGIRRDINTLINNCFPEVANALEQQYEQELHSIRIPDILLSRLDGMFESCQSQRINQPMTLQALTDCFLIHFGRSTVQFHHRQHDTERLPPVLQYIELLKCEFIMGKLKAYPDLQNMPRMSHWPGYIDALHEKLSHQCSRFETELIEPDPSSCSDEMLFFFFEPEQMLPQAQQASAPEYNFVLEALLATERDASTLRKMRLMRKVNSEDHFRIIETCGYDGQQPNPGPKVVEIDTQTAVLIPIYADPADEQGILPPLEIIIEQNQIAYRYAFLNLSDILSFQEALTGYKVVAGYMESHAFAVFVRQADTIEENVSVQLWIPSVVTGRPENEASAIEGLDEGPRTSAVSDPDRSSSATSILSSFSIASASSTSRSSSGREDSITVRVGGRPASTDYGVIRSSPRNPLLVLFTRDPKSSRRSMVSIKIDDDTKPNPERCNCQQFRDCCIAALEQRRRSSSILRAQRLETRAKWDLLPLATAPSWSGLLRVSILFPTQEARYTFSGAQCNCKIVTEGDVDACVSSLHQGLLGIVRVYHRRHMILWQEQRNNLVGLESTRRPGLPSG